ncbi:hypothetical protein CRG98_028338 [Punica granatum]|uniref:Uncharacterized protein n=1 Tax=Punica granatum TaxID=22663 RepID=A0A2I0J4W7_PUNGR|nr:hypothetical protein CRG98_028338 [Punica granatum]
MFASGFPVVNSVPSFGRKSSVGAGGPKWGADSTHVDLFCWLDRGDLMALDATQTLLYLRYLTILGKPFPKVYGLGLTKTFFEWVRIGVSEI